MPRIQFHLVPVSEGRKVMVGSDPHPNSDIVIIQVRQPLGPQHGRRASVGIVTRKRVTKGDGAEVVCQIPLRLETARALKASLEAYLEDLDRSSKK